MSKITLTYTKTTGHKMAYNQFTHEEIEDIDDLVDDANKEIVKIKRENEKLKEVVSDIEFIVTPEKEKFLISKWNMIYGRIQALRILHNIDIKKHMKQ